jgi:hypothetical protein
MNSTAAGNTAYYPMQLGNNYYSNQNPNNNNNNIYYQGPISYNSPLYLSPIHPVQAQLINPMINNANSNSSMPYQLLSPHNHPSLYSSNNSTITKNPPFNMELLAASQAQQLKNLQAQQQQQQQQQKQQQTQRKKTPSHNTKANSPTSASSTSSSTSSTISSSTSNRNRSKKSRSNKKHVHPIPSAISTANNGNSKNNNSNNPVVASIAQNVQPVQAIEVNASAGSDSVKSQPSKPVKPTASKPIISPPSHKKSFSTPLNLLDSLADVAMKADHLEELEAFASGNQNISGNIDMKRFSSIVENKSPTFNSNLEAFLHFASRTVSPTSSADVSPLPPISNNSSRSTSPFHHNPNLYYSPKRSAQSMQEIPPSNSSSISTPNYDSNAAVVNDNLDHLMKRVKLSPKPSTTIRA